VRAGAFGGKRKRTGGHGHAEESCWLESRKGNHRKSCSKRAGRKAEGDFSVKSLSLKSLGLGAPLKWGGVWLGERPLIKKGPGGLLSSCQWVSTDEVIR